MVGLGRHVSDEVLAVRGVQAHGHVGHEHEEGHVAVKEGWGGHEHEEGHVVGGEGGRGA